MKSTPILVTSFRIFSLPPLFIIVVVGSIITEQEGCYIWNKKSIVYFFQVQVYYNHEGAVAIFKLTFLQKKVLLRAHDEWLLPPCCLYAQVSHQAVSQFWIFGLFQACHYARIVVWTPYDQKLRLGKSWMYVPLR